MFDCIFIFIFLSRPFFGILFISNFNLNRISAALMGNCNYYGFAHAETTESQAQQMETIVVLQLALNKKSRILPVFLSYPKLN